MHPNEPSIFYDDSELSLDSVKTGNSIEFRLKFKKGRPRIRFSESEQAFEISLPHWTAVLVLAGALLAGGAITAEKILEIEHLCLDNEKIRMELRELNLRKLTDNSNPNVNSLNVNINQFNQQINQYNIHKVVINKITVKSANVKKEEK